LKNSKFHPNTLTQHATKSQNDDNKRQNIDTLKLSCREVWEVKSKVRHFLRFDVLPLITNNDILAGEIERFLKTL